MGRKYNKTYKKGKWDKSKIATRADLAKTAWKNLTLDKKLWKSDTRKYDFPYKDTGADYALIHEGKESQKRFIKKIFKYTARSKKKPSKTGENKHYRRYWTK